VVILANLFNRLNPKNQFTYVTRFNRQLDRRTPCMEAVIRQRLHWPEGALIGGEAKQSATVKG
jgi:hypothetical protein